MRLLIAGVLGAAVALGAFGVLVPDTSLKSTTESNAYSIIGAQKVKAQYEQWTERYEEQGGNGNLVIALGPDRGHALESRYGTGAARLDLVGGTVEARITGLDADVEWDLWLIDNAPDRDDLRLLAGRLVSEDGAVVLEAELPELGGFQVDRVAVTRAGHDAEELSGSATLFQRLYTALESEEALFASDFSGRVERVEPGAADVFTVRSAMAAGLPIHVDADVLFDSLVADGAELFINEQFNGNGRTCATCHPATNNFTIDVPSIDRLKDDDALFVAEFVPALAVNFEKPALMRGAALILENVDGMDDLANKFVMRGVPHTLGMTVSLDVPSIPFDNSTPGHSNFPPGFPAQRTGWGGDGAPNTGSLRDFATGAVNQHFPNTLARMEPGDFRFPDSDELDAMEAFQLALGRTAEIDLASISFKSAKATKGVEIFNRLDTGNPPGPPGAPPPPQTGPPLPAGKCALCHNNAGANINSDFFTAFFSSIPPGLPPGVTVTGNANFGTGVNELGAIPADLIDPANNPRDGGFGIVPHDGTPLPQLGGVPCVPPTGGFGVVTLPGGPLPPGLCEEDFNVVSLVEAADSQPFFHNNSVDTIEAAVAFYNDDAFNNSPGGQLAASIDTNGIGIRIDSSEVTAVATMLRVVNVLENIRSIRELATGALSIGNDHRSDELLDVAISDVQDAIGALAAGKISGDAVDALVEANIHFAAAQVAIFNSVRINRINRGLDDIDAAEAFLIVP